MDPLYLSIILLVLGVFIVLLELFIPSAGLLSVLAALCFVGSVVAGFFSSMTVGLLMLLATLIAIPVLIVAMIKIWPKTPIGRRILIERAPSPEAVVPKWVPDGETLVGQIGVAKTKMLPSGIIEINGRKYDALSDGLPIEEGEPVKVIAIKNNHIVVARYDEESDSPGDLPAADTSLLDQPLEELGLDSLDENLN